MNIHEELNSRSGSVCELCGSASETEPFAVSPKSGTTTADCALLCSNCRSQIEGQAGMDPNHWRCLNNSMWSEFPVVQVLSWRMLNRLQGEDWARDLLDMLYLEDDILAWAKDWDELQTMSDDAIRHTDSNGALLQTGDSVVLIKDLDVKGANFTAKRGTTVKNISVVSDNSEQIEGRVNGQHIVILTKFVKKAT